MIKYTHFYSLDYSTNNYNEVLNYLRKKNIDIEDSGLIDIDSHSFYVLHKFYKIQYWTLLKYNRFYFRDDIFLFDIVASEIGQQGFYEIDYYDIEAHIRKVFDYQLPLYINGRFKSYEFDEKLKSL